MAGPMIADGRGNDIVPTSEEELVDVLRRFDAEFRAEKEPRLVTIYADRVAEVTPKLHLGLGADDAMMGYDHGLASAYSLGPHRDDMSEIGFAYGDGYSEFLGWTRVSIEDALAAAREFFRTGGRRPTNVDWVDI